MRRREHQSGFSAIVILLVVGVVAVLAVAGLVVYQRHNRPNNIKSSVKNSAATSSSQQTAQPAAPTLDIKEWGVHMTLDSTTASMYYYINPQLTDVAYLSLKTISAIVPNCAADKFSLGAISRLTPAEHQAAISDPTKGIPGSIQIGNYWYGYTSPQGGCINATQDTAVQKALPGYNIGEISKAFDTLAAD